jgi:exonuclease VII small subunit
MAREDKELFDLLKSVGLSDEDIAKAVKDGNIKLGMSSEDAAEKKEEVEEEAPESSEKAPEEKDEKEEDKKEEKIEKSEMADLIKSFEEKSTQVDDLVKSLEERDEKVNDLVKSLEETTELVKSLQETIEKIERNVPTPRTISNITYLEKGGQKQDDLGKTVYSSTSDKEAISDLLLKSMETESDPIVKSQIEGDLMNYVGGNGQISKETAMLLYGKGIRIAQ